MKKKGIWIVISVLAVLGLLMGGFGCAAPAEEITPEEITPEEVIPEEAETIYIGFVGPLSGPYSAVGEDMEAAVKLVVREFNEAGGAAGRPVEVLIRDSKFMVEADPTAAYCDEFITKYNVAFVTGGYSDTTGETVQANTVYRGTPFMSLVPAAAMATRGDKIHPYKFTTMLNCDESAFTMVPYLFVNNLVSNKVHIIAPDYGWGWAITKGWLNAVPQYGGEVVKTTFTPLPTIDMSPYIADFEELLPGGDGTIFGVHGGTEDAAFVKAVYDARLQDKGYNVVDIPVDSSIFHFAIADPNYWKGIYTAIDWYYGLPEAKEFSVKYYNEFGEFATWSAARVVYLQTYWALKAIDETGTTDPAVWTEWLRGKTVKGATDTLEKYWDPVTGRIVQQRALYRFKASEDMVDIFPELPEVGADWDHLELIHLSTLEYMEAITSDADEIAGIEEGDYKIGAGVRAYWEAYCEEHGLEMPPNLRGEAPVEWK